MKLLIDENLPKRLKPNFIEHEIYTVSDMGWNSKKSGELLNPKYAIEISIPIIHKHLNKWLKPGPIDIKA